MNIASFFLVAGFLGCYDKEADADAYSYDFGAFKIAFPAGEPSDCGETGFKDLGSRVFMYAGNFDNGDVYINHIDRHYDGEFEIIPGQSFDSIVVYDRYVNSYGMRLSETEGVKPFDTAYSDLPLDDLFYYSACQRMLPVKNLHYTFEKYGHGKDYWKPHKSGIDKDAFQKWYDREMIDFPWKDTDRREVFSYQRQLKIELYSKGEKVVFTIKFFHRDGEC